MKKIELKLHREENLLLLDSQDVYNFLSENTEKEIRLAYFIDKYCELLNYPYLHNKEMKFDDGERCELAGFVNGYMYAKNIKIEELNNGYIKLKGDGYIIELERPFEI